jgi:hypothetical protein
MPRNTLAVIVISLVTGVNFNPVFKPISKAAPNPISAVESFTLSSTIASKAAIVF